MPPKLDETKPTTASQESATVSPGFVCNLEVHNQSYTVEQRAVRLPVRKPRNPVYEFTGRRILLEEVETVSRGRGGLVMRQS